MHLTSKRKQMYAQLIREVGIPRVDKIKEILPNGNVLYLVRTDENIAENHYMYIHPRLLISAENRGFLIPGKSHIIDTSSSNSAISLAITAQRMGYPLRMIIPTELEDRVRAYTVKAITDAGGEVQYPDPDIHTKYRYVAACAEQLKREIRCKKERDFVLNHSRCLETLTALENVTTIICNRLRRRIDYFVPGVGNGATILGPGKVLRERYGTVIVAWEPVSSGQAYEMMHPGIYEKEFGLPPGKFRHNIYGVGVPDVKFPFLNASVHGGKIYGLGSNPEHDLNSCTYNQVLSGVKMVTNQFMTNDFLAEGGAPKTLGRPTLDRHTVSYEKMHDSLLKSGFAVGRSAAASIAVAAEIALDVFDKNFLIFCYDSATKYTAPFPNPAAIPSLASKS